MIEFPVGLHVLITREQIPVTGPMRVGQFNVFTADFSAWRLFLDKQTPCIWITAEHVINYDSEELVGMLHKTCLQEGWLNNPLLVFIDGRGHHIEALLKKWTTQFIILDGLAQADLEKADFPRQIILKRAMRSRSLVELSPYEINKPVTGSAFFGRQEHIDDVVRNPNRSYLFVGIHRMGKTSLLKEMKRRLDKADPPKRGRVRRVYIDCTVVTTQDDFLKMLMSQLERTGFTLFGKVNTNPDQYMDELFAHYYEVHGGTITFLLDEFDRLLTHMRQDWNIVQKMQKAIANQQIRLIAAGYRNAIEITINEQSPFSTVFTPVWLKPLSPLAIEQLVLIPFNQLGVAIEEPQAFIHKLQDETAGMPNYIQHYCRILLEYAELMSLNSLSVADIQKVHEDARFRGFLLNSFMSNTDLIEQAIVYALVIEKMDQIDRLAMTTLVDRILTERKLTLTKEQINLACQNLRLAGVFTQEETHYKFAIDQFQKMLRQERDVLFLFERAREALQTEKILA
ncbi:MAG: ATP-binding protein [Chloroflexota bacterium]